MTNAKGLRNLFAALAMSAVTIAALACNSTSTPSVSKGDKGLTSSGQPSTSASMGIPRSQGATDLFNQSPVVVLGTIESVLEEKMMGGYGVDGMPLPAGDGGLPYTDYSLYIDEILKDDGNLSGTDQIVLRMFGHRDSQDTTINLESVALPEPGDYMLFALGRNLDGTYGSGPEGLLKISGDTVEFSDGEPFQEGISPDQLIQSMREMAAGPASSPAEPPINFLRQDEGTLERAATDSLLHGTLLVEEGCLRIKSAEFDVSYIPVWPHQFRMEINADEVHIRNWTEEHVASVGEDLRIQGGEIESADQLSDVVGSKVNPNCVGPFWVVAGGQYEDHAQVGVHVPPGASMGMPVVPSPSNTSAPSISPGVVVVGGNPQDVMSVGEFTSLLTEKDVESVAGAGAQWESQVRDYRAMAPPQAVENITSWYGVTFTTPEGGNGLTFTLMDFDSADSAMAHFEMMKDEVPPGVTPVFSNNSFKAEVNAQGIGSILTLVDGDHILSFHTTSPEGEVAMVSLEGLEDLVNVVLDHLPPM